MQTCRNCFKHTQDCLCDKLHINVERFINPVIKDDDSLKIKILKPHQRYECRLCGGDHKEVQCNDADFAGRDS